MVFVMVALGGVTRLTESGLSITCWQPVTGVLPPLSEAQWQDAFAAYKAIPQYQAIHAGMSLADFKTIYFWEWLHRLWGRLDRCRVPAALSLFPGAPPNPARPRAQTRACFSLWGRCKARSAGGWWRAAWRTASRSANTASPRILRPPLSSISRSCGWRSIWSGLEEQADRALPETRRRRGAAAGFRDLGRRRLCRGFARGADRQHLPADGRALDSARLGQSLALVAQPVRESRSGAVRPPAVGGAYLACVARRCSWPPSSTGRRLPRIAMGAVHSLFTLTTLAGGCWASPPAAGGAAGPGAGASARRDLGADGGAGGAPCPWRNSKNRLRRGL